MIVQIQLQWSPSFRSNVTLHTDCLVKKCVTTAGHVLRGFRKNLKTTSSCYWPFTVTEMERHLSWDIMGSFLLQKLSKVCREVKFCISIPNLQPYLAIQLTCARPSRSSFAAGHWSNSLLRRPRDMLRNRKQDHLVKSQTKLLCIWF